MTVSTCQSMLRRAIGPETQRARSMRHAATSAAFSMDSTPVPAASTMPARIATATPARSWRTGEESSRRRTR